MLKLLAEGPALSSRPSSSPLANLLAVMILIAAVVGAIEWLGYDLGWRRWLTCHLGGSQGLLNAGVGIGIALLFFRGTRGTGAGVLVLAIGGSYALELLTGGAGGACIGPRTAF